MATIRNQEKDAILEQASDTRTKGRLIIYVIFAKSLQMIQTKSVDSNTAQAVNKLGDQEYLGLTYDVSGVILNLSPLFPLVRCLKSL